jgi:hypothetical protein
MAIRYMEGADHQNSYSDLFNNGIIDPNLTATSQGVNVTTATRWGYGKSFNLYNNWGNTGEQPTYWYLNGLFSNGYFGFAVGLVYPETRNFSDYPFVKLYSFANNMTIISMGWNNSGTLTLSANANSSYSVSNTSSNTVNRIAWNYYEIGFNTANNYVELRVNGVTYATLNVPFSYAYNIDRFVTYNSSQVTGNSSSFNIDDIYMADSTGTAPGNTFLGDCRIITLFPNAPGSSTQWTPLTANNWYEVCETAFDGNTSYVYSNTVGNIDLYKVNASPVALTSNIYAVQVISAASKTDASPHTINNIISSNGVNSNSANITVLPSYMYNKSMWTTDPATGARWTQAGVANVQIGVGLSS